MIFQSTHPHGVRPTRSNTDCCQFSISIHAPAWGATTDSAVSWLHRADFNPRTRMGCDFSSQPSPSLGDVFQSTHPHGVRHGSAEVRNHQDDFNPRTRMGCDGHIALCPRWINKFQSTHPHGVRQPKTDGNPKIRAISIHAPAWGATPYTPLWASLPSYFNPRTRMGCDLNFANQFCCTDISIHAPAWGAT